jgi:hypothetical protein
MTPCCDDVTLARRPAAYARWSARWDYRLPGSEAGSTHSDFMQPVFALASIAGMLSSGQRKEVPMPGNQRGDRGRPRPTPGRSTSVPISPSTDCASWRCASPVEESGKGRAAAGRRAWHQPHRHGRRLRPQGSEELIAQALHPYPDDLDAATEGGLVQPRAGRWNPDRRPEHPRRVNRSRCRLPSHPASHPRRCGRPRCAWKCLLTLTTKASRKITGYNASKGRRCQANTSLRPGR